MIPTESMIYWGHVWHQRFAPVGHSFTYPHYCFSLNIDELSALSKELAIFKHNRFGLFSIWDTDYIGDLNVSIRTKLMEFLSREGEKFLPSSIFLVTVPRYFGYVFNPVSFYICMDESRNIGAVVNQVNNTFGETHLYLMKCQSPKPAAQFEATFTKTFFVSPFFDRSGDYRMEIEKFGSELDLKIDLYREGKIVLASRVIGSGKPISNSRLLLTVFRYPLCGALAMSRIHIEAFKLYFKRKLGVYTKPASTNKNTIHSRQNWIHRFRLWGLSFGRKPRL